MLYEQFSWLYSDDLPLPNFSALFDATQLTQEIQKARDKHQQFLCSLRAKKITGTSASEATSQALEQLSKYHNCLQFLRGHQEIKDNYQLMLEYILAHEKENFSANLRTKFFTLLNYYYQNYPEQAGLFIQKNKSFLSAYEELEWIVEVNTYATFLSKHLEFQKNGLGISSLLREFIDSPENTAAAVLWLVRQKIEVLSILEANILQEYMDYHFSELHSEGSPIMRLYGILKLFDEASPLIKEANQIQCPQKSFEQHSLCGTRITGETLRALECWPHPIELTPTQDNLTNLLKLFGVNFFIAAGIYGYSAANSECNQFLKTHLNQLSSKELGYVIERLAEQKPKTLTYLSTLIEQPQIDSMIASVEASVFHLLPYHRNLSAKITPEIVNQYLDSLNTSMVSGWDMFPKLAALLSTFEEKNLQIASIIYENMLHHLLLSPQFLDDIKLFSQMRKYYYKEAIILKKLRSYETELFNCCDQETAEETFAHAHYEKIEKLWFEIVQNIINLRKIQEVKTNFPPNKFALQAQVAKKLWMLGKFHLDTFVDTLKIEPVLPRGETSDYERLLIEILIEIDDASLRNAIVQKIRDKKYKDDTVWMDKRFAGEHIFFRAASGGNIGLLRFLESELCIEDTYRCTAIRKAAENNQWETVKFFYRKSARKINQNTLDDIFSLAGIAGELQVLSDLSQKNHFRLSQYGINHAFLNAVSHGHLECVTFLSKLIPQRDAVGLLQNGMKTAFEKGYVAIGLYLGNFKEHPALTPAIHGVITKTLQNKQFHLLAPLCSLRNKPTMNFINKLYDEAILRNDCETFKALQSVPKEFSSAILLERAFYSAIKSGSRSILAYLLTETAAVSGAACDKGLLEALRFQKNDIINDLLTFKGAELSAFCAKKALMFTAKTGNFGQMKFICEQVRNKPPITTRNEALTLAASRGHAQIVEYLYSLGGITVNTSNYALTAAVRANSLPCVKSIYGRNPSHNGKHFAERKAKDAGYITLVNFFKRVKYSHPTKEFSSPLSTKSSPLFPHRRYTLFSEASTPDRAQSAWDLTDCSPR